jgi:hypothetical protein
MRYVAAFLFAALVLAGCGGGKADSTAPAPALPGDLASALAGRADAVAAALEAGDAATAHARAAQLRAHVIAAVNAGRVPPALAEPLLAAVNQLAEAVPEPAPPPETGSDETRSEKHGKHGKGKGHDRDD